VREGNVEIALLRHAPAQRLKGGDHAKGFQPRRMQRVRHAVLVDGNIAIWPDRLIARQEIERQRIARELHDVSVRESRW
jgi:signal transduction histidine kinase